MRAEFIFLLTALLSCSAPPVAPSPPSAPVLSLEDAPSTHRFRTLSGIVDERTMVRVFFNDGCHQPVLLQKSGEALSSGLLVELIAGVSNHFSALAIGPTGLVSPCSAPVTGAFTLDVLEPPAVFPVERSRGPTVRLKGKAPARTKVRLFGGQLSDAAKGTPWVRLTLKSLMIDAPDGGALCARGILHDGGATNCSQAIVW